MVLLGLKLQEHPKYCYKTLLASQSSSLSVLGLGILAK